MIGDDAAACIKRHPRRVDRVFAGRELKGIILTFVDLIEVGEEGFGEPWGRYRVSTPRPLRTFFVVFFFFFTYLPKKETLSLLLLCTANNSQKPNNLRVPTMV
jgi:hypothetical protein